MNEKTEPERLDKFLAEVVRDYSRSQSQELIGAGNVWVDGQVCLKPAYEADCRPKRPRSTADSPRRSHPRGKPASGGNLPG